MLTSMQLTSLVRPLLAIAALTATASCAGAASIKPDADREFSFTTTEFTRPLISMSAKSDTIYFGVLGDIYRVGLDGGLAEKLDLGPGWKDHPVISADGSQLAFRSDVDGLSRVWVKTLSTGIVPVDVSGDGSIDPIDFVWGRDGIVISTGKDSLTPHRRTYDLSVSRVDRSQLPSQLMAKPVSQRDAPILVGTARDGRNVYLYSKEIDGFRVVDSLTGRETQLSGLLPPKASQIRLSPDGTFVGYAGDPRLPNGLSLLELSTGNRTATGCLLEESSREDGDDYVAPTYSLASGARFAILAKDGKLQRCDRNGAMAVIPAEVKVAFSGNATLKPNYDAPLLPQILFPTIATDQGKVAFSMADRIWIQDLRTGGPARLTGKEAFETMPSFSGSGKFLTYVEVNDGVSRLMVADIGTGGAEVVHESRSLVHANPRWANCECKIAFSLVDAKPASDHMSKLMVVDLAGQSVTHVTDVESISYTETYHAAPQWDADDSGLFYIVNRGLITGKDLVHHALGGEPRSVMRMDSEVLDIQLSPDYSRMTLRYRAGIAMAPFSLVASKDRRLAYKDLEKLVHPFRGAADFVVWADNDSVAWVVQNRLYTSRADGTPVELAAVRLPERPPASESRKVAYLGGRIISMRGDEVVEDGVLVTTGSKIAYVGTDPGAAILAGAEIVDVRGKTIIPGLVDVHQHAFDENYGNEPAEGGFLYSLAAYGVTTAFDPAPRSLPQTSNLSFASAEDDFPGATYYSAGLPLLAAAGHHIAVHINNIDDARMYVGRLVLAGVPLVKDYTSPNRRQRRFIVQAAKENGLGVVSHQFQSRRAHFSTIADGYTSIEHSLLRNYRRPFYSDVVNLLRQSGVSITPTLVEPVMSSVMPYMDSITPRDMRYKCVLGKNYHGRLERSRRELESTGAQAGVPEWVKARYARHAELLKSGVLVNVGSHGPPHGLSTHWELWALSQGGASPLEAIRAATANGAIKLNLQHRIGSLEVGKDADMVILNSNPMDGIRNTADIWRVVRRGRPLEWHIGSRWPLSSDVQADWAECRDWNMGVAR